MSYSTISMIADILFKIALYCFCCSLLSFLQCSLIILCRTDISVNFEIVCGPHTTINPGHFVQFIWQFSRKVGQKKDLKVLTNHSQWI